MISDSRRGNDRTIAPERHPRLAKVALAVVRSEKTLSELAGQFDIHPSQSSTRHEKMPRGASDAFCDAENAPTAAPIMDVKMLHAKIGELTLETIFIRCSRQIESVAERKAIVDKSHDLPVAQQAAVLGISRGSVYYPPRPTPPSDLAWIRKMGIETIYRRPNTPKPEPGRKSFVPDACAIGKVGGYQLHIDDKCAAARCFGADRRVTRRALQDWLG